MNPALIFWLTPLVIVLCLIATACENDRKKHEPKSDDEAFEDWIKVCEYRGMSYEFIEQCRETHRQTKLLAARSRATSSGGPQ